MDHLTAEAGAEDRTVRNKKIKQVMLFLSLFLFPFFLLTLPFSIYPESASTGTPEVYHRKSRQPYVPGEVIVQFRKRISSSTQARTHQNIPVSTVIHLSRPRTDLVTLQENENVEAAVERYSAMPEVEYAQPNYIYYPALTPDDDFFGNLWGLNNTGQTVNFISGTPDADIDAPEVWDLETGNSEVIIAVIDTGVDFRHPDLTDNMWRNSAEIPGNGIDDDQNGFIDDDIGWDFFDVDNDPMDPAGHGTHVSGIIAAEGNNGKGVSGIGWNLKIMALKVGGVTEFFTSSRIIDAIDYSVAMGAEVINASWGGDFFDQAMLSAITRARDRGVLFVAAAGNSGRDIDSSPFYPASYDLKNIISVAATDQNDGLASFSNFGENTVDVGAPGVNIFSTYIRRVQVWSDNFDDGDITDWSHGGVRDSWGPTDELSLSPSYSLTDSPLSDYENDTASWVKRGFDLTNQSAAVLSGSIRGSSEEFIDRLFVQTSEDDRIWIFKDVELISSTKSSIEQYISGNLDDEWRIFNIDIGSIDGSPGFFRFLFDTDISVVSDGWHIDDLSIEITGTSTENDLAYLNGTSMATPLVSGLAALILSANPDLNSDQVKALIIDGVDTKSTLRRKVKSNGRINAFTSLTSPAPDLTTSGNSAGGGGGCAIMVQTSSSLSGGTDLAILLFALLLCTILRKITKKRIVR